MCETIVLSMLFSLFSAHLLDYFRVSGFFCFASSSLSLTVNGFYAMAIKKIFSNSVKMVFIDRLIRSTIMRIEETNYMGWACHSYILAPSLGGPFSNQNIN